MTMTINDVHDTKIIITPKTTGTIIANQRKRHRNFKGALTAYHQRPFVSHASRHHRDLKELIGVHDLHRTLRDDQLEAWVILGR